MPICPDFKGQWGQPGECGRKKSDQEWAGCEPEQQVDFEDFHPPQIQSSSNEEPWFSEPGKLYKVAFGYSDGGRDRDSIVDRLHKSLCNVSPHAWMNRMIRGMRELVGQD